MDAGKVIDADGHAMDYPDIYSEDPHWDMTYPESAALIEKRQDLSEEAKRKILCDNACRFYPSLTETSRSSPQTS